MKEHRTMTLTMAPLAAAQHARTHACVLLLHTNTLRDYLEG